MINTVSALIRSSIEHRISINKNSTRVSLWKQLARFAASFYLLHKNTAQAAEIILSTATKNILMMQYNNNNNNTKMYILMIQCNNNNNTKNIHLNDAMQY